MTHSRNQLSKSTPSFPSLFPLSFARKLSFGHCLMSHAPAAPPQPPPKPELKLNPDRLCANCLSIYLSTRGQMKPTKRETTMHKATKREGKRQRVRERHNKLPFSHCINPQPSNLSRVTTKFINSLNCHMSFLFQFQFQFSVVFCSDFVVICIILFHFVPFCSVWLVNSHAAATIRETWVQCECIRLFKSSRVEFEFYWDDNAIH